MPDSRPLVSSRPEAEPPTISTARARVARREKARTVAAATSSGTERSHITSATAGAAPSHVRAARRWTASVRLVNGESVAWPPQARVTTAMTVATAAARVGGRPEQQQAQAHRQEGETGEARPGVLGAEPGRSAVAGLDGQPDRGGRDAQRERAHPETSDAPGARTERRPGDRRARGDEQHKIREAASDPEDGLEG